MRGMESGSVHSGGNDTNDVLYGDMAFKKGVVVRIFEFSGFGVSTTSILKVERDILGHN